MARVRTFGDNPANFYNALPPITKLFGTVAVACAAGAFLKILPLGRLFLYWPAIFKGEVWRLITCVCIGGFSVDFAVKLLLLIQYGSLLERGVFQHSTADFVYMLLFGATVMTVADLVLPFVQLYLLGGPLVFMMMYVWSRNTPTADVSIMGLMTVQAFWLPWCLLAVNLMFGRNVVPDLTGILVGHLYHFLKDIHPAAGGVALLETPNWLKRAVHRSGIGHVPVQQLNVPLASNPQFRAFGGRGRRLAD